VNAASFAHRSLKKVEQRASHAALVQDVSRVPPPPVQSQPGRLNAIIVPAGVLPSAGHQLSGPARRLARSPLQ
jgi:hypothetical protein